MKFSPIEKDSAANYDGGKIIIIGAGVSGLFAANALTYAGFENYIVLEATDRIGGRVKSVDNFHDDVPLDVGAEWIHASDGKIVKDMLVFKDDATIGEELGPSEFIKYQPQFWFLSKRNRFLECLYQETKWKRSTWWHWLEKYVYQHVKNKVQMNCPVKEIHYGDRGQTKDEEKSQEQVKIILEDGSELLADKVICTIPLAALKKNKVSFYPSLPEKKLEAIEATDMPPGFRILFEMKEKFYPDLTGSKGFFKQMSNANDLMIVYDPLLQKDLSSSQNVLAFVAIGNESAGEMSKLNDEDLAKAALAKIDELFDGKGSKNYVKHVVQNWSSDPYILGAYTFPGVPHHHRAELGKTVEGKLFFAGEHTSLNYFSLVPGAADEGRKAAMEALGQEYKESKAVIFG